MNDGKKSLSAELLEQNIPTKNSSPEFLAHLIPINFHTITIRKNPQLNTSSSEKDLNQYDSLIK